MDTLVKTKILDPKIPEQLQEAIDLLKDGECVAFPTETVYGLGADALNQEAVKKIFLAKGRPADNPLIVHIADRKQINDLVVEVPAEAQVLIEKFWPGPLTLVLKKKLSVPDIVTAGLSTVAVRMPDHPVALQLLKSGVPLAAPSANISGKPSPTRAEHVFSDLNGRIPAIVDGGATQSGVESTVIDCTISPFRLLRPGGVTFEQLKNYCQIEIDRGVYHHVDKPRSPGMKYKHYSPDADLVLVMGEDKVSTIVQQVKLHPNKSVGIMAVSEHIKIYREHCPGTTLLEMGSKYDLPTVAENIYHLLREVDARGLELVFVEGFPEENLGMAIMNRLRRAAGKVLRSES
ncbi:MAG: threonylcarbamoyl-AMP synthase [Firmicutes bacterium]|nr:threonylcarbamoyl-AMP synthase [Bacillota bacterium]